jgi:hypothetical protein
VSEKLGAVHAEPAVLQNDEDSRLISKPFGRNELIATVESLLFGDRAERDTAHS